MVYHGHSLCIFGGFTGTEYSPPRKRNSMDAKGQAGSSAGSRGHVPPRRSDRLKERKSKIAEKMAQRDERLKELVRSRRQSARVGKKRVVYQQDEPIEISSGSEGELVETSSESGDELIEISLSGSELDELLGNPSGNGDQPIENPTGSGDELIENLSGSNEEMSSQQDEPVENPSGSGEEMVSQQDEEPAGSGEEMESQQEEPIENPSGSGEEMTFLQDEEPAGSGEEMESKQEEAIENPTGSREEMASHQQDEEPAGNGEEMASKQEESIETPSGSGEEMTSQQDEEPAGSGEEMESKQEESIETPSGSGEEMTSHQQNEEPAGNGEEMASKQEEPVENPSGSGISNSNDRRVGERSTLDKMDPEEPEGNHKLWAKIFSYLLLSDRKKARLVCRAWNDKISSIADDGEQLLCSAPYDWDTVVQVVQNSRRGTLNLEFNSLTIIDPTREFWRECGPRMKSLLVSNCEPMEEIIKYVVKYCENLESLSLTSPADRYEGIQKLCSAECIESLIGMNATRRSLASFKLSTSHSNWIPNDFLPTIYRIYPKIKRLSISCDTVDPDLDPTPVAHSSLQSTGRCAFAGIVSQLITSNVELEGIFLRIGNFQIPSNYTSAAHITSSIIPLHFPQLKEVQLELMTLFDQQHHDFFSRHGDLTYVDCTLFSTGAVTMDMTRVMNCVLDSCPNLCHLQIVIRRLLDANVTLPTVHPSVFAKIKSSRLKTLAFNFDLEIRKEDTETVNSRLKTLRIGSPGIACDAFRSFMKVFRSLNHLEVNNVNDHSLQAIFEYQRCLKSLRLSDWHSCTNYGFTGCHRQDDENVDRSEVLSMRRLDKLQSLDLQVTKAVPKITQRAFQEFRLPNLSRLHVTCARSWKLYDRFLDATTRNSPNIEAMTVITNDDVTDDHARVYCEHCERLRCLKFACRQMLDPDNLNRTLFGPTALHALAFQERRFGVRPRWRLLYRNSVERIFEEKTFELHHRISSQPADPIYL